MNAAHEANKEAILERCIERMLDGERWDLDVPEGTVFLTRINFGLGGLLANLGARGPWRGIIREYIDDAPPCTELGRLSAATTRGPAV